MNLLYCSGSTVLGWHDSSQNVPASAYGSGITVIPWTSSLSTLSKIGPAPSNPRLDARPYATPVLNGPQLIAYAQLKQDVLAIGGISVGGVKCSTDAYSLTLLQGANSLALASPSMTFQWVQSDGTLTTLTAAQINTMFIAVSSFLQDTFMACAAVIALINSSTYTTTAQVDAYAWPTNS